MGICEMMAEQGSRLGDLCQKKASDVATACQSLDNSLRGHSKAVVTEASLNHKAIEIEPGHVEGWLLAAPNETAKAEPRFGKF